MTKKETCEYVKKWREENKERLILYRKQYKLKNKDKIKEKNKIYCANNKEKETLRKKRYRQANKELIKVQNKEWISNNREKTLKYYKKYRDNNKGKIAAYSLKSNYGITIEQKQEMLNNQHFRCANKGCTYTFKNLTDAHVDHVHNSSPIIIRGLLCRSCNTALGILKESEASIEGLKQYLKFSERKNNYS